MADFLDEKRKEIQARLKELKPLVEEYDRLEAAERALSGVGTTARATSSPASTSTPRRRRRSSGSGNSRRGRPRGSGTRGAQALEVGRARPGITNPGRAEWVRRPRARYEPDPQEEGRYGEWWWQAALRWRIGNA